MFLVFAPESDIMATMEKSAHQNMFSSPPGSDPGMASPQTDYGDAEVQFSMGLKFASNPGAAQDYQQAAEWYHKAAEQNHSLAQFNLGVMYAQGQGVTRDAAQSAVWFGKAARSGDAGAQYHLGDSCHRASIVQLSAEASESRIEAYKWYRLAAVQGYGNSIMAWSNLTRSMTQADVVAGDQRVAAFEIAKPEGGSQQPAVSAGS
ncbi:MAG TPA: tetratricopeptide repeat protein [Verrucomicrobiae bacterium]|nr:tetratricopeptide repeat protein [Verrucomicrobiae bacterium]